MRKQFFTLKKCIAKNKKMIILLIAIILALSMFLGGLYMAYSNVDKFADKGENGILIVIGLLLAIGAFIIPGAILAYLK